MSGAEAFALPAAIAIPLLVALALGLVVRRGRRVARAFDPAPRPARGFAAVLGRIAWLRYASVLAAALSISGALLTATAGSGSGPGAGGPVVLVLDVSNSMLAEDVRPDRLTLLRAAARRLLPHLAGTPVGIVVFAGRAYALCPPTTDPEALDLYLTSLDPQMVTQTGTSLAAAIRQAVGLLATTRTRTGSVVLLSDGNAPDPRAEIDAATELAARAGIPVHTVGIGTPAGAPVPRVDPRTGRRDGFIPDPAGGIAISRLDEDLLSRVAMRSRGEYLRLDSDAGVDRLAARLGGGAAPSGLDDGTPASRHEWLVGLALLFLLAEIAAARTQSPAS